MGSPNMLHVPPTDGTTVTSAATTLKWKGGQTSFTDMHVGLKRIETCALRFDNVGATLTTFKVYGKLQGDDSWVLIASTAADYGGTANNYVIDATVHTTSTWALIGKDLTTMATAKSGLLILRTVGLQSIKFTSTCATSTVIKGYAHGSGVAGPLGSPLPVVQSSGLPTPPTVDVAGSDTYTTIVTVPATGPAHYMFVTVETKGAIISLDGGTTAHLTIPLDTNWFFPGLDIPAGSVIQGKNETAGQNYANLRIYIW